MIGSLSNVGENCINDIGAGLQMDDELYILITVDVLIIIDFSTSPLASSIAVTMRADSLLSRTESHG